MESLRIESLEARYRLPLSRKAESRRLDRALHLVLDEALERALERLGYPLHEEICIREVHAPVRLRLSADDDELALVWSLALARSLDEAVRQGRGDQVARYGSRVQALADFAAGVAKGDLRRAWAWSQLGFGPVSGSGSAEEAARALEQTLLRERAAIVPVLRALAETGWLGRLMTRLSPAAWPALAGEALDAAGAPGVAEALRAALPILRETFPADASSADPIVPELRRARRAIRFSPLGRVALGEPILAPEVRSALAVLALLDADPVLFRRASSAEASALVAAATSIPIPVLEDGADPALPLSRTSAAAPAGTASRSLRTASGRDAEKAEEAEKVPSAASGTASEAGAVSEDFPLPLRTTGETWRGGLLFLVSVLDDLGLPDEIAATFRERSFRWALHRLALRLAPLAPEDPAALAFAGLPPGSPVPFEEPAEPSPEEEAALAGWIGRLVDELRERLRWEEVPDAVLLDRITRRSARIAADPGWLDVHLSLADVTTDVRRARLDLDPGYVPWLGVVLRFLYE